MRWKVDILTKQYEFISSCIDSEGRIVDKKLKSPLEFQYHYTSFILSSVLVGNDKNLDKVVCHYLDISKEKMEPSNDFNVFLLLLAINNDRDNLLRKYKVRILNSIYHKSDEDLYKLNNNFRALRLVGLILEDKATLSRKNSKKIDKEIEWILNLQFDDGFFPDSNMEYRVEKNKGIPHLIYHVKILMCVGLAYLYLRDDRLWSAFDKAIKLLLELSIDNYYFFYGRSTNAIFGYGCFYLSLILAYNVSGELVYYKIADSILKYLGDFQHPDGHISINLNYDDNRRFGFDSYMYDIVYNAYSNAMFLYGKYLVKNENKIPYIENKQKSPKISLYKNSGFLTYSDGNIKYCFNIKGHQNTLKHYFDSRVSPLSLLYFKKDNKNLLPAIGIKPNGIFFLVEKKFYLKNLYAKLYHIVNYDWLPLLSGNSFYYIKNGLKYYPFKCVKELKLKDTLILKFESKARSRLFKKQEKDEFVISIGLSQNLKYKIIFYSEVESVFYAYRDMYQQSNFMYSFSKEYMKLPILKVATSYQVASLHRYKFKKVTELEIEVKTSDR